ncbi:hypothetical protein Tco_0910405 [Tanacetum coccineum]|uniref:Uncharacterized protein n=1 Tax=Tanacetum coccineum TaxID=301880 RepID=A0ABQ5CU00_9ASTR
MSSITAQQTKLDLELVPKEKRLEIGKCNGRLNPGKKQREPTFQVVLDALALTPCYYAFLTTADVPEICPRVHGQNFDELPTNEDILSFFKELSHIGDIKSITNVVVDQMHQPWRTFATIVNISLSGKITGLDKLRLSRAQIIWGMYYKKIVDYVELLWEDFTYQIDNRGHKKKDKIPEMRETKAYKTYLGYATGVTPPKKARKFKKPASPKLTTVLVSPEEPTRKSKRVKRPARKSTNVPTVGVVIRDTPVMSLSKKKEKMTIEKHKGIDLLSEVVLTEEAQYEEVRKKSLRDFHKTHPSGSGTVTKISPSATKIKPSVTNEGTGAKPGVPDVTEEESTKSEDKSWGRDEDDRNNDRDSRSKGSDQESNSGDNNTQSDNEKGSDFEHETDENETGSESDQEKNEEVEDDEEEKDDVFVKTPSISTNDEDETNDESRVEDKAEGNEDKGIDYTTNQFDDDVNVRLNEPVDTDEGFIQKEGTDVEMINVQQGNENPEILINQVIKDAHVTISTVPKKTEVLVTSSSHSFDLASKLLKFSDIPHTDAKIVSPMDVHVHHKVPCNQTPTLLTVPVSVISDSSPVYSTVIPQSLPSFTPPPQKSTLTPPPTTEVTNPPSTLPNFASVFQFNNRVTSLEKEVAKLKKDDPLNTQVTALVDEHLDSRLGATRDEFMNYLSASITARITEQVKIQLPQILPKELSNFAHSEVKCMVTESLEHAVLAKESSQPKLTYKAAASLTEFELKKILIDKMDESQSYLMATEHRECYDGLIKSYDLDKSLFSTYDKVYSLKRSQKDKDKAKDLSVGLDQGLKKRKTSKNAEPTKGPKTKESKSGSSKGTKSQSKSSGKSVQSEEPEFVFAILILPQDKEENLECYKALSEKLDWDNPEGGDYPFDLTKPLPLFMNRNRQMVPVDYFFNNDLKYLQGGISTMTYTTSVSMIFQALNTWSKTFGVLLKSPMINMHFGVFLIGEINVKSKLTNLSGNDVFDFAIALRMFTRSMVIQKRVEDLQLGVESYPKKINVTKPKTTRPDLRKKDPYTPYQDPQGFIYVDNQGRNRLMRSYELYKFSDGTLTRLQTSLGDVTKNIRMEYLP